MKKILVFTAFMVLFSGCADFFTYTEGRQITQEELDSIIINKSTKNDLETQFGAPDRITPTQECDMWHYDFAKISSFGSNVNESNVFCVDKKGKVIKKLKGGKAQSKNPLLR